MDARKAMKCGEEKRLYDIPTVVVVVKVQGSIVAAKGRRELDHHKNVFHFR